MSHEHAHVELAPDSRRIVYTTPKSYRENDIIARLSEFSVQEFQQREPSGEIRSYYLVRAGRYGMEETFIIPKLPGEVENERDAVLAAIPHILCSDLSITMHPPLRYTKVDNPERCEVIPLPLTEFFKPRQDYADLLNLCPSKNVSLGRYPIFDPRAFRERGDTSPIDNWVELYGRRKTTTDAPCLLYCANSYYGDIGLLGRQIDEGLFLPVIYNASLVTNVDKDEYSDDMTDQAICRPRYFYDADSFTPSEQRLARIFNSIAPCYIYCSPGHYIDWQSLHQLYAARDLKG